MEWTDETHRYLPGGDRHAPGRLAGEPDPQSTRDAEELLMRVHLGLSPIHSLLHAVRVLHDEGREAFERERGPRCEYAHQWKPRQK